MIDLPGHDPRRTGSAHAPALMMILCAGVVVAAGSLGMLLVSTPGVPGGARGCLWLLAALAMAYLAWTVLVARGRIHPHTNAGFVLAAYGLASRMFTTWLYALVGTSHRPEHANPEAAQLVSAVHTWSLAAYVGGLSAVVLAVWAQRPVKGGRRTEGSMPTRRQETPMGTSKR